MTDLLAELQWRGFVQQATPHLKAHLARGPATAYCGFDPTAPSLQLGNLVPVMLLTHLQRHGHRPIALMGGGTGLIGDPSGRRTERPLLPRAELRANLERQQAQMAHFLDFAGGKALLLDNAAWLEPARLVEFLRDVGKHFTVNVMLQKESVQARLESGLSFTEFSYMLLQAYDFLQLYRSHGCTLQVGGSDQWGNITAGVDLIRRVESGEAHALVSPLVTTASGTKFGKTEAGAVYLAPALTSPYRFFQFWINVDDRDVEGYLKLFTLRARDEIRELMKGQEADPGARKAQRVLALDVTRQVHGLDAGRAAEHASLILFGDLDPHNASNDVFDTLAGEIPTTVVPPSDTVGVVDALTRTGLVKSKGEARRAIEQGGIYVNQQRERAVERRLGPGDWIAGRNVLLRKGKKEYALLRRKAGGGRGEA
ncbi:MAG: tyrosine--tRNA ligase [Gemmatimonadales bacterium]